MLLVKKQITINVPSEKRIMKIIPISYQKLAAVTDSSIVIHDIKEQIEETIFNQDQSSEEKIKISSIAYHPKLKRFYIILSVIKEKQKNFIYGQIKYCPEENLKQFEFVKIYSFEDHEIKYEKQRQIKPDLILQNYSNFHILMRKFYHDTLVIVFLKDKPTQQFYMNEQCLSSFNDHNLLISYRKIYHHNLSIDLIDIEKQVKIGKFTSTLQTHRINYGNRGIIMSIKKLQSQNNMMICLNEKEGKIVFLEYNYENWMILKQYQQPQCSLFQVLCIFRNVICTHKYFKNTDVKLVLEDTQFSQKDSLSTTVKFEEWETFYFMQQYPLIINYSQDIKNKNKSINIDLLRFVEKKQGYVALADQILGKEDDEMLQKIMRILI